MPGSWVAGLLLLRLLGPWLGWAERSVTVLWTSGAECAEGQLWPLLPALPPSLSLTFLQPRLPQSLFFKPERLLAPLGPPSGKNP